MPWKTTYEHLLLDRDGRDGQVARVTLNRPDVHNAFHAELIAELHDAFDRLGRAADVRVVVIAGAGTSFSAGGDVNWMRSMKEATAEENIADARRLTAMLRALTELPQPTIARVHGGAYGGGVGLACCCDLVVASGRASFALTEVRLGLSAATITPFVVRRVGEQTARRLMLTAERVDAAEARRIGLADRTCKHKEIDTAVEELAGELLLGGPEALATAKQLLDALRHTPPDQVDELTAKFLAERRASDEGQEGLAAFLDKRSIRWPTPARRRDHPADLG